MANNNAPLFIYAHKTDAVTANTANTAIISPGGGTTYPFDAFTKQSVVKELNIKAQATTTAGMIRVWLLNGGIYWLLDEIQVSAITPSATVVSFQQNRYYNRTFINGDQIVVTTEKSESFACTLFYGELES